MLYRIGLRHAGGGLHLCPEGLYFVRLQRRQGRPLQPEITRLPLESGAWSHGQPVYNDAVAEVLRAWLKTRHGRPPRPLVACLNASTAYFGAFTLPMHEVTAAGEIELQIRQALPLHDELALDFERVKTSNPLHQRVTYIATRQSEVSAITHYFQRLGCPLSVLDLNVFALWRASVAVNPALLKRPIVALLWIGRESGLFALYQDGVVVHSLAWFRDGSMTLSAFVQATASQAQAQGLFDWVACVSHSEGTEAVIMVSRQLGMTAAFLDLMPFGVGHQALAEAFLAFGLAWRGVASS